MLAQADFICPPSHREVVSLEIIAAVAAEGAAVGSRLFGISDAFAEIQTGLLCELKSALDLSNCLNDMLHDDILRQRLGGSVEP